ncbi:MAG TPA: Crp/Fnr family transcriptional regulator [Kofleriaceae bacterium]
MKNNGIIDRAQIVLQRPDAPPFPRTAAGPMLIGHPEPRFDSRSFYKQLCACMPGRSGSRRLIANEALYTCGTENQNIYFVESGYVKVSLLSQNARQCLLDICAPGDMVGESCLLCTERIETVIAMTQCVVRAIPRTEFLETIFKHKLVEASLQYLTARLLEQQQIVSHFVVADSEGRLAATLLRLARKLGKPHQGRLLIDEKITQEELAEIVGTTRSRVGYFLKRFRATGLIEQPSQAVLLINETRLDEYVQACL